MTDASASTQLLPQKTIVADLPTNLFEFFYSLGETPMTLADPVFGGGLNGCN